MMMYFYDRFVLKSRGLIGLVNIAWVFLLNHYSGNTLLNKQVWLNGYYENNSLSLVLFPVLCFSFWSMLKTFDSKKYCKWFVSLATFSVCFLLL